MSDHKHDLIAELFSELQGLSQEARDRIYAERKVPEDVASELESLLRQATLDLFREGQLGAVGGQLLADADEDVDHGRWGAGKRVGDYEIRREIARGGMGVVFEAEQISLRRSVALKVIQSAHLASDEEIQRFRNEAEAVASLEHSGIVPIYEVCESQGEQFFSMALLRGGSLADLDVPIDDRRAAALIEPIARAIHHAHSRNIVHRDLKPQNVLLTADGEPKVTDFGLAKNTRDGSDLTVTGAVIGTPGFMAPEQASGQPQSVGPPADVYSLGAVLYYLVTGQPPFREATLFETLFKVASEDAKSPRVWNEAVSEDIASICLKCLEKDPALRYASALEVARELRRYLHREPIIARPISGIARAGRWCRRNVGVAVLSATTVLALIVGTIVSVSYALLASERATLAANREADAKASEKRARHSEEHAKESEADMWAFTSFLVNDILSAARPKSGSPGLDDEALGINVKLRDALLAASERIDDRFEGRPGAKAITLRNIGATLRHCGERERAEELLRQCVDAYVEAYGPLHEQTLNGLNSYGTCLFDLERYDEAAKVFRDMLDRAERGGGFAPGTPGHRLVDLARMNLCEIYLATKRYALAIPIYEEAMKSKKERELFEVMNSLSSCYAGAGRIEEGIALGRKTWEFAVDAAGETSAPALEAAADLAQILAVAKRYEEAEEILRPCLRDQIKLYTRRHGKPIATAYSLASVYVKLKKYTQARRLLAGVEKIVDRTFQRNMAWPAKIRRLLGQTYLELGDGVRAKQMFERVVAFSMRTLGAENALTIADKQRLAKAQQLIDGG